MPKKTVEQINSDLLYNKGNSKSFYKEARNLVLVIPEQQLDFERNKLLDRDKELKYLIKEEPESPMVSARRNEVLKIKTKLKLYDYVLCK